jgi:hypothetical protein
MKDKAKNLLDKLGSMDIKQYARIRALNKLSEKVPRLSFGSNWKKL